MTPLKKVINFKDLVNNSIEGKEGKKVNLIYLSGKNGGEYLPMRPEDVPAELKTNEAISLLSSGHELFDGKTYTFYIAAVMPDNKV